MIMSSSAVFQLNYITPTLSQYNLLYKAVLLNNRKPCIRYIRSVYTMSLMLGVYHVESDPNKS